MEIVMQYVPIGMLGLLGLFVLFGMLFGLIRGLKRSGIRLATVVVALLVAFFLTPVIGRALYSANIEVAGQTPAGWVDVLATQMEEYGQTYLQHVMPYLTDFVLGTALAIINVVLFFVLYFVAKILSWIVYAILAPIFAPKKDKKGNRNKKHAWFGLLVGAVQGVVLFFFFMIPVNGVIDVVDQVAAYQTLGGIELTPAANSDPETESGFDLTQTTKEVSDGLGSYKMVLRYSGLQWLSSQAFNYQMTIRVAGNQDMCLGKDIVTGLELFADWEATQPTWDRLNQAYEATENMAEALAVLDENDYQALRYIVNKVFSLEILHFGDALLGDLDQILAADVYPMLAENYAVAGHEEEFTQGVRAMVNYLAQTKLDLVRQDLLTALNAMEKWYAIDVTLDEQVTLPLPAAFTRQNLETADYLDILLAPAGDDGIALNVMLDSILDLQLFKIISQAKADNVLLYGKFFDGLASMDEQYPGISDFIRKFTASFLGEKADSSWHKLGDLADSVLPVARDHLNIMDELNAIMEDEDVSMPQAIMTYLSGMLATGDDITDDEKYAQVDRLAGALYKVIFAFDDVADFARQQVTKMNLGEIGDIVMPLFDAGADEGQWKTAFRSIVNMADLFTKSQEILDSVLSTDFSDPDSVKDLLEQLVGTDGTDGLLDAKDVADVVFDLLQSEQIQETVDKFLDNLGDSLRESFAGDDDMSEILDKLDEALGDLQNMEKEELENLFQDLWDQLSKSISGNTQGA